VVTPTIYQQCLAACFSHDGMLCEAGAVWMIDVAMMKFNYYNLITVHENLLQDVF
jgi:hypothetical protein